MTHSLRIIGIALVAGVLLAPAQAGAIVPPRDCKFMTVKGKRYNIKADQLRCSTARRYAERYLRTRIKPRYYTCTRPKNSALAFTCTAKRYRPDRTFYAIKRS